MINVPVKVQDALREGDLKKNYRFIVCDGENMALLLSNPYRYTALNGGAPMYAFYSPTNLYGHTYTVYKPNGSYTTYNIPVGQDDLYTFFDVNLEENDVLAFDTLPENTSITVTLNGTLTIIQNAFLVKESVKFDERMCSSDTLKFGLCEGSSLEFQYFNYPNITGMRLQAFIDVEYEQADHTKEWYTIPMGWFTVKECSRQASTGIRKVTAYNKLKSDYLDTDITAQIQNMASDLFDPNLVTIDAIESLFLSGYQIIWNNQGTVINPSRTQSIESIYGFRVQLNNGMSGYYYPYIRYDRFTYTCDSSKKVSLEELDYYIREQNTRINQMKQCVLNDVVDGENYWNNNFTLYDGGTHGTTYENACCLIAQFYGSKWVDFDNGEGHSTAQNTRYANISTLRSLNGLVSLLINMPVEFGFAYSTTAGDIAYTEYTWDEQIYESMPIVKKYATDRISNITIDKTKVQNVTLRDIVTADYEMRCQYGKLDRMSDMFSGVKLNNSRLCPANILYPANNLYPQSDAERGNFSMYGKLWADEGNIRKFRNLNITYKTTEDDEQGNPQEVEKIRTLMVNSDGTDDYDCTNNWLFKNIVWDDADDGTFDWITIDMATALENVTWFPFEMWCAGLPYIETGDEIEINIANHAYTSYVLRRSLNGIQNLQDDFINGTLDIF